LPFTGALDFYGYDLEYVFHVREAGVQRFDPSRTFADFGKVEFTSLGDTVAAAVEYYKKYGTQGEFTHLKHSDKK